jgi:hypothetical protein
MPKHLFAQTYGHDGLLTLAAVWGVSAAFKKHHSRNSLFTAMPEPIEISQDSSDRSKKSKGEQKPPATYSLPTGQLCLLSRDTISPGNKGCKWKPFLTFGAAMG